MISDSNVRFVAVLSMAALFVSGVAIGFALDRIFTGRGPPPFPPPHRPPVNRMLEHMSAELGLRVDQSQAVEKILLQGRDSAQRIMERARPDLEATRKGVEEQIRALLDPTQAEAFVRVMERRRKAGPPHGPRPGRPWRGPPGKRGPPPPAPPGLP